MKRIVAIAVVLALMSNCTYSLRQYRLYARGNILELSSTIGDVIDAEERAEYDLFPEVGGFREARFYAIPEGGYEVEIITDRRKYVAVNRDTLADQILRDYFSQYNTPQYSQSNFEKKWGIIAYDILGFPITKHEVNSNLKGGCYVGAITGTGVLACLGLSVLVAALTAVSGPWGQEEVNEPLAFTIILGGALVGGLTGSLFARATDGHRALSAIEEARMPRVVD